MSLTKSRSKKTVYVELDRDGVIRIFRTTEAARDCPFWGLPPLAEIEYGIAVGQVRRRVFDRDDYTCVRCGQHVTWGTGEMNEVVPRGEGGEISLQNSETLCHSCHMGPLGHHAKRLPAWNRVRKYVEKILP